MTDTPNLPPVIEVSTGGTLMLPLSFKNETPAALNIAATPLGRVAVTQSDDFGTLTIIGQQAGAAVVELTGAPGTRGAAVFVYVDPQPIGEVDILPPA